MIHSYRFDLMAKYFYIKANNKQLTTNFFKELYHNHLITFNNFHILHFLHQEQSNLFCNVVLFFSFVDNLNIF